MPKQQALASILGIPYRCIAAGAATAGQYEIFLFEPPPGVGTPPHQHDREDEGFLVIDGEIEATLDGKSRRMKAGEFALLPRGKPHHFRNPGKATARLLVTVTPPNLVPFFQDLGVPLTREGKPPAVDAAQIENLKRLSLRHGIRLL